jgi:hypothetical protein
MTEVREIPECYTVTIWPEGTECGHAAMWCLTVAYRGRGLWVVLRGGEGSRVCLAADGQWDIEPNPSSRDDVWLADHRFDKETAFKLARRLAPHITVNGCTVTEAMTEHERICVG